MEVGGEEDESLHRVTSLAWAGFQVLADRCVSWETQQSAVVSSGLAQQVKHVGSGNIVGVVNVTHAEVGSYMQCKV